jgi:secreted PhoX family phosphatase
MLKRRDFLRYSAALAGSTVVAGSLWQEALASFPAQAGPGPYGALLPPDGNGLRLPAGFTSRVIAQSTQEVIPGSGFSYPILPDGGACFADGDGWIYVANSEFDNAGPSNPLLSGVTSIKFDAGANITDAYKILNDTRLNCAGGATPWDTWLSCEEVPPGVVWECDPWGVNAPVERIGMGRFRHEAAASDRDQQRFYLTEDESDGGFYRFTPDVWDESKDVWPNPTLGSGLLEIAEVNAGVVSWLEVPDPDPDVFTNPTRNQLSASTAFNGGEGIVYRAGHIYFATKGDNRIWDYETPTGAISVLYDDDLDPGVQLTGVDNVAIANSGDLLIAEDKGDVPQQLVLITPTGIASPLVEMSQQFSEIAGPAWNPAGTHLYFSSQRGPNAGGVGITYEVTGPFRRFPNGGCQGF